MILILKSNFATMSCQFTVEKLANQYQYTFTVARHQFTTMNGRVFWIFQNLKK